MHGSYVFDVRQAAQPGYDLAEQLVPQIRVFLLNVRRDACPDLGHARQVPFRHALVRRCHPVGPRRLAHEARLMREDPSNGDCPNIAELA